MVQTENKDNLVTASARFLGAAAAIVVLTLLVMLGLAVSVGIIDLSVIRTALGVTDKTAWYFSRSSGTVAYLLLAGSTVWGLLLSTKLIKEHVPAALSLSMHNVLSWLAIFLTGLHALVLLLDGDYSYRLPTLLVPFTGPYRPAAVGLGIIGFYLMALTSFSFYMRKRIGQKMWRRLHYLTFAAYLLATFHALTAGTDSGNLGMQIVYCGSGLAVLFLTNYRLISGKLATSRRRRSQRRA